MKKIFVLFAMLFVVVTLAGCGNKKEVATYDIAMITDIGDIDDESFNQGTYEGIKKYADENNISRTYYKPLEESLTSYIETIELAIDNGAKIVVTPGYMFEAAIFETQDAYPDVTFILIDGVPHAADDFDGVTNKVADNTYSIIFAEHESGFLAGYAAVKEGFTQLGFMGGAAYPAVIKFGYGFLQGAEYAAEEMGLANDSISVKYEYTNSFKATPEIQVKASSWYNSGTEAIFVAAGGAGTSVMNAANALTDKYVIGVDVDQSGKSPKVITSAKKELAYTVYENLKAIYTDHHTLFKAGETMLLDSTNDGIGLPKDFSRFENFTPEEYNTIYAALKANTNNIRTNITSDFGKKVNELGLTKLDVTVIAE